MVLLVAGYGLACVFLDSLWWRWDVAVFLFAIEMIGSYIRTTFTPVVIGK